MSVFKNHSQASEISQVSHSNAIRPTIIEKQTTKQQQNQQDSIVQPQQIRTKQSSISNTVNAAENKVNQIINLFKIKQISTKGYREIIEQIATSFTTMDNLTNRLEQKVDYMLKQQQQEFVKSYIGHMKKIKEQFGQTDKKMQQYEKKIKYYENEGQMSHLVIKVNKLQQECKKLYKNLSDRDKIIKDNQLTIKVQKSQIKRYEKELKLLLRQRNQHKLKLAQTSKMSLENNDTLEPHNISLPSHSINQALSPRSIDNQASFKPIEHFINSNGKNNVFPTELMLENSQTSIPKHESSTDYLGSIQSRPNLLNNKSSQKSLTIDFNNTQKYYVLSNEKYSPHNPSPSLLSKVRQMQLKKQVNSLKKRNQLLNSYQSFVLQAKTDMQTFFISCVNQIKQQIRIRKKMNSECTFDDFKKQDKIELLINIISNDDILSYLYERIFKKKRLFADNQKVFQMERSPQSKSLSPLSKQIHHQHKAQIKKITQNAVILNQRNTLRFDTTERQRVLPSSTINVKQKKSLSMAKRRFSKHISQNSLLPKIHFNLEY